MLSLSVLLGNCIAICLHIYAILTSASNWKDWTYLLIQICSILTQIFCIAGFSLIIPIYPISSYLGNTLFDFAGILYIICTVIVITIDLKVLGAFIAYDPRLKFAKSIYFKGAFYTPYLLCFLGHSITFCLLDIANLNQYADFLNFINEIFAIVTSLQGMLLDSFTVYIVFKSLYIQFEKKLTSEKGSDLRNDYNAARALALLGLLIDYAALSAYVVTIINSDNLGIILASDVGTASVSLHIFLLQSSYAIIKRIFKNREGGSISVGALKSKTIND